MSSSRFVFGYRTIGLGRCRQPTEVVLSFGIGDKSARLGGASNSFRAIAFFDAENKCCELCTELATKYILLPC